MLVLAPAAQAAGSGTVSIRADVSTREPASPTRSASVKFTVDLARTAPGTVTVNYATADGTADAFLDYQATGGTLTFTGTQTSKTVTVPAYYDIFDEPAETFTLELSGAFNATIAGPGGTRTGTITDATANPRISVADASVIEGDSGTTTARFVVSLSEPSAATVTASATSADGSATTAGGDYAALAPTTVTFDPGETAEVVTVTVNGDTRTEPSETFALNLSAPSGATIADGSAVGTIVDDDAAPLISIADAAPVTEGNTGTINASFTVSLSHASASAVTVNASTADGTATQPADYTALPNQTVTIPAGSTSQPFTVAVNGDTTSEADELFGVTLSAPANATLADAVATGTITDDDDGPKIIAGGGGDVLEGTGLGFGTVNFTVTLAQASGQIVTVDYTTVGGTAKAVEDYVPATGTLLFLAGETSKSVDVTLVGDVVGEAAESLSLHLSNAAGDGVITTADASANILNDDGSPLASVSIGDASIGEGDTGTAAVSVPVTVNGVIPGFPVVVSWSTADGAAVAGSDYTASSGVITFIGASTQNVTVPVRGDTLDEADEAFTVEVSTLTNAAILDGSGSVTITDDDLAPTLSITSPAVAEGKAGQSAAVSLTVSLSAPSGKTVTVDHTTAGVTATADADFLTAGAGTLTFAPGQTSKTVTVNVLGDGLDENDETVTITLSNASNATPPAGPGVLTITDDDAAPVVSVVAGPAAAEGDAAGAGFTISLSAPSGKPIDVGYDTVDGTATGGADFTAVTGGTIHFNAGEQSKPVTVAVLDDAVADSAASEQFTLALAAGPTNAGLDPIASSATGTILDDDGPATLTIDPVTVAEGATGETGTASFAVHLVPAAETAVTVNYATANGVATAGSDYTATSGTLTIPAGEDGAGIDVPVLGDNSDEIDETFTLTLSAPSGAVLWGGATLAATGTIDDDDNPVLWIVAPAAVAEGNTDARSATFQVRLSTAQTDPVTVNWATAAGTATAGSDYTTASGTVTFDPSESSEIVTVPVLGDTTDETDETFTVTLSTPGGAVLAGGGFNIATGTIDDDDGPTVAVAGPASAVTEGNSGTSNATFAVTLSAASPQTVTVAYATANGTATAGSDYTAGSGTLTFTPGQTAKTVAVPVNGDTTDEVDETFSLGLSTPSDATLGTASASATVDDDDGPTVAVAGPASAVTEGNSGTSNATFAVTLSAASPQTVTVAYATANGTATAGSDYTAGSGTVTFGPGETVKAVIVAVKGDTADEHDETFTLGLSTPVDAVLGTPTASATISDDDVVVVSIGNASVVEGDSGTATATFTISLSGPAVTTVTVNWSTKNGSASAGSDYGASSGTVTFAPGETSKTVTVTVYGDRNDAGNETFVVQLSGASNSQIGTGQGTATIIDDERPGYLVVGANGAVFAYGSAPSVGSLAGLQINQPIVGSAKTASGKGYWLVARDGGVFNFGDAPYRGSTGAISLNKPIVGMAGTPSGKGYWLVASDGGIFSFGDATFHGSTGAISLNKPVVGMAPTPSGKGYWLVASDGGVFSFGDATFHGSTGAIRLNQPIVGMAATLTGDGYWFVARDGGIFSFGDASFLGAPTGSGTIVTMAS